MTSRLLLFNCVVLFVLLGSVCAGDDDSFVNWIYDNKIPFVTLIKGNERFENGLMKSKCLGNGWHWQFFKAEDWDWQTAMGKGLYSAYESYEIDEIREGMTREKEIVHFTATITVDGKKCKQEYSLVCPTEQDAINFTGKKPLPKLVVRD